MPPKSKTKVNKQTAVSDDGWFDELKGPPRCELWTPYLHDQFPPRSRIYTGPTPNFRPNIQTHHTVQIPPPMQSLCRKRKYPALHFTELINDDNKTRQRGKTVPVPCSKTPVSKYREEDNGPRASADANNGDSIHSSSFKKCDESKITPTISNSQGPFETFQAHLQNSTDDKAKEADTWGAMGWDYQYRPDFAVERALMEDEVGDFKDLSELLDGATMIYCLNQTQLYGLLRASVGDVTDLGAYTWAPHTLIDDKQMNESNPLRPLSSDPYYSAMCPDLPFRAPQRDEVEGITRPSIDLPPDATWTRTPSINASRNDSHDLLQRAKDEEEEEEPKSFSQASAASEYNSGDTKEDIERYLSSQRWFGASGAPKNTPPYFRDSRMIHWFFKTLSICGDLKIDDLTLADICTWNRHNPWWNAPSVQFARLASSPVRHRPPGATTSGSILNATKMWMAREAEGRMGDQARYTLWHGQRRWNSIKDALEHEVRLTADILTILYFHGLPLTCHVKRWNRKARRYLMLWEQLSVRVSTPSMLLFTGRKTADPLAPPTSTESERASLEKMSFENEPETAETKATYTNSIDGPKKRGRKRQDPMPKPSAALTPKQLALNRDNKSYNVVCSVAISNFRRNFPESNWCDLMRMQSQSISMVACLVISAQYPKGIVKFFAPDHNQLQSIRSTENHGPSFVANKSRTTVPPSKSNTGH